MKKVYIVGNGPSACSKPLGQEIDAADVVVRINNFKTQGFEQYVGTKTDILFTCRLNEYFDTLQNFPEVILCLLMNPLDGVEIPQEMITAPNISERIDWPEVDRMTALLNLKENCYPSTGFICMLKMVDRFRHVNVVGFDHFAQQNGHYFAPGARITPPRHDADGERRWFQAYKDRGLLSFA